MDWCFRENSKIDTGNHRKPLYSWEKTCCPVDLRHCRRRSRTSTGSVAFLLRSGRADVPVGIYMDLLGPPQCDKDDEWWWAGAAEDMFAVRNPMGSLGPAAASPRRASGHRYRMWGSFNRLMVIRWAEGWELVEMGWGEGLGRGLTSHLVICKWM